MCVQVRLDGTSREPKRPPDLHGPPDSALAVHADSMSCRLGNYPPRNIVSDTRLS